MPYITDQNDNHIIDENGNKIEFTVEYENGEFYKHKEPLHINDDGHIDCENRHIIIKEALNDNHAVSKKQLDQKLLELNTKIDNIIKLTEQKILTQIMNFRNEQIKNRFHRKIMKLPKKTSTWIKLLSYDELPFEAEDLTDIMIFNVWLKRFTMYHHGNCVTCQEAFGILEYYYDQDMKNFYIYFTKIPDKWSMDCLIEYIKIPKIIKIGDEEIQISNENPHNNKYIPKINIISNENENNN